MPMYYPDLKSVQTLVRDMQMNKGDKQYKGIYPNTERELLEARKQLAKYFRDIWKDEIQALEVELAVDETNYYQKIGDYIMMKMLFS